MFQRIVVSLVVLFGLCSSVVFSETKDMVLTKPSSRLNVDLKTSLYARKSVRALVKKTVAIEDVGTILWAGYGVNRDDGKHTVPSAMGKDLIDLYVALDKGVYYYEPGKHVLKHVSDHNIIGKMSPQKFVADASFVVIIIGKPDNMNVGKPEDRMNYVNFTAGAASQDMYLAANALNLGTVVAATMNKDLVTKVLNLNDKQVPIYIMPMGTVKQ